MMLPPFTPFKLAREIDASTVPVDFTISASDCEPFTLSELLAVAGDEESLDLSSTFLGYSDPQGLAELRSEIALQYDGIDANQILACVPQEALYLLLRTLLKPGDHIVTMFPSYQPHYSIAEAMGCEVSRWQPEPGSAHCFSVEGLRQLLRPTTRLVLFSFPHNPTGFTPSADEYLEIIAAVQQTDAVLISDEVFRDLTINDEAPLPSAIDVTDRALVLNAMSKSYGLGGLRIGWVVTHDVDVLQSLMQYRDYTSQTNSSVSEALALLALRSRSDIVTRNCDRIRRNLLLLEEFTQRWSEVVSFVRPTAGSLCLMELRNLSADEFCRRALEEHRVMAASSSLFDYGDRHVRIGLGRDGFAAALERIDQLLQSMTDSP